MITSYIVFSIFSYFYPFCLMCFKKKKSPWSLISTFLDLTCTTFWKEEINGGSACVLSSLRTKFMCSLVHSCVEEEEVVQIFLPHFICKIYSAVLYLENWLAKIYGVDKLSRLSTITKALLQNAHPIHQGSYPQPHPPFPQRISL